MEVSHYDNWKTMYNVTIHVYELMTSECKLKLLDNRTNNMTWSVEQRSLNSSMSTLVPNSLGHLSKEHLDFYVHWCLLLDLEAKTTTDRGGISDLWCKTGLQREQDGNCISRLSLSQFHTDQESACSILTFTRHADAERTNLTDINMIGVAVNDYMIISTEMTNHLALCNGTVISITEVDVQVAVESESLQRLVNLKGEMFRLDRYNSFSTSNILYTNLSKLMLDEPQSEKLRKLVIENHTPAFVPKLSKTEIEKVKGIFKPLNKPQKTAVLKVLMSKDYVLIKGYPGTGKTATIAAIVRVLNLLGLSVLLTSYTHSAVDNILLKLLKDDISFVRLGKTSKIHPQIQKYSADVLTKNLHTVADIREFYSQKKVVATSCLGINHAVFTQKRFDVCIVDEASQVLLPACLGPLFCADRFVLVGDPKQLPPVVQSREARGLGMDQSLFAMLDGVGGTYELNLQYRMNSDIMALSNLLVYDGALRCGSDDVANNLLQLTVNPTSDQWIQEALQGKPYKAAVFVDTSKTDARESKDNCGMVVNVGESQIVQKLVHACLQGGVSTEDIGVIAPYRHQVRLIHDSMSDHSVEVNTVDQYQGRDKDVIIISFTRSFRGNNSDSNKSGELLKDVRRLNVAVSRAKKKLIMVGDQTTLNVYQPLSVILKMMADNDLIITLPNDIS